MSLHRLPNGREVYLSRLAIASTYSGMMEGSPETASPHILQGLPEQAARMLSPAKPLVIVAPPRMPLPGLICVAELGCQKGARKRDTECSIFHSQLYVCWFDEDTARTIDAMVAAILPHLNWKRDAEDYDLMDF